MSCSSSFEIAEVVLNSSDFEFFCMCLAIIILARRGVFVDIF
jgi:hypothetical protein